MAAPIQRTGPGTRTWAGPPSAGAGPSPSRRRLAGGRDGGLGGRSTLNSGKTRHVAGMLPVRQHALMTGCEMGPVG